MLRVYNSKTQTKEDFVSLEKNRVKMYVCGPTVYNFLHVGNFRGPVFFNLVRNFLEFSGYQVQYIFNFTDVDDRIIERAKQDGVEASAISEKYIAEFKSDFEQLKLRKHSANPKVTEHMEGIIDFIQLLMKKGKAYEVKGDVYFSIAEFPEYGSLSHRKVEDLIQGVRVDVHEGKRSPGDFALWKAAKPGEPFWPAPWGQGRPGWHIECSAMIYALCGESIDIHGGGLDLLFPHHENEIAQSEGATGKPFVRYWMHNNMLQTGGQKMSKSLGNFVTLREFLQKYHPEIYKWMILSVHYRSISDFSDEGLARSVQMLAKFYSGLNLAYEALGLDKLSPVNFHKWGEGLAENLNLLSANQANVQVLPYALESTEFKGFAAKISAALEDDFNTPQAVAVLHEALHLLSANLKRGQKASAKAQQIAKELIGLFSWFGNLTSLFEENPKEFLAYLDNMLLAQKKIDRAQVETLVQKRAAARKEKNFALSDSLRDELQTLGIQVCDTAQGSLWEVEKS